MHAETVSSPTTSRSRLKAAWFQNDPLADGLDFGLATDRHTLEQAFRLQHDQYVAHGYMDAHPSGWRLSLHNALSPTRVFVARRGGRVVGTMTLITDSPLGLPMDEIYRMSSGGFGTGGEIWRRFRRWPWILSTSHQAFQSFCD